ncbi:MAG: hypothetical protein ABEI98_12640 [Halorhabdus sp.]
MVRRTLVALLAVTLLTVSGAVVATDTVAQSDEPLSNATQSADQAYVTENGDVVLVYETPNAAAGDGYLTANLTDGQLTGLYELTGLDTGLDGSLSALINRTAVSADGTLSMPRPAAVEDLSMTVASTRSPTVARGDMSLAATVTLPEQQQMLLNMFDSFETSGAFRTNATTLSTTGSAQWSATVPGVTEQAYDYQLRATADGHRLEVTRNSQISSFAVEQWNTEQKARQRLQAQFGALSGVSTKITLQEYTFEATDQGGRLQIAYTVRFEGLNQFLRTAVAQGIAQSAASQPTTVSLDPGTVREQLDNLSLERAGMSYKMTPSGGSASWTLSVEGYNGLARAYLTLLAAQDDSGVISEQIARYEAQRKAMRAANYGQTVSWDATIQKQGNTQLSADASISQRAENWTAYVNERQSRDLPPIGRTNTRLDVTTEGDRIVADGSFLFQQDGMYTRALDAIEQQLRRAAENDPSMSPASIGLAMDMVRNLGFQQAQMDATVNATALRVEGNASFDDLSTIATLAGASVGQGTLETAHMEMTDAGQIAFLRLTVPSTVVPRPRPCDPSRRSPSRQTCTWHAIGKLTQGRSRSSRPSPLQTWRRRLRRPRQRLKRSHRHRLKRSPRRRPRRRHRRRPKRRRPVVPDLRPSSRWRHCSCLWDCLACGVARS